MAMTAPQEERTFFYDTHYRPAALGAPSNESESRWFDEFSVFNHLHLPKPQGLSFTPPQVLQAKQFDRQRQLLRHQHFNSGSDSHLQTLQPSAVLQLQSFSKTVEAETL